jgi:hypothetical protein
MKRSPESIVAVDFVAAQRSFLAVMRGSEDGNRESAIARCDAEIV